MKYYQELTNAMQMLSADPKRLFIGQSVKFGGQAMKGTFANVADVKLIEYPVAENMQLGYCTGLAMAGYLPISIFPRIDFLLSAMDQLVNHLDKYYCTNRVIIRTSVGATKPMNPGVQHTQDHTIAFQQMLKHIPVLTLKSAEEIRPKYEWAMEQQRPVMLVEYVSMYND